MASAGCERRRRVPVRAMRKRAWTGRSRRPRRRYYPEIRLVFRSACRPADQDLDLLESHSSKAGRVRKRAERMDQMAAPHRQRIAARGLGAQFSASSTIGDFVSIAGPNFAASSHREPVESEFCGSEMEAVLFCFRVWRYSVRCERETNWNSGRRWQAHYS
jgi:hypothetical protein